MGTCHPWGQGQPWIRGFDEFFLLMRRRKRKKSPSPAPELQGCRQQPGDKGATVGSAAVVPHAAAGPPPLRGGSRTPKASGGGHDAGQSRRLQRRKTCSTGNAGPARSSCPGEISPAADGGSSPGSSQTPSERSRLLGEPGPPAPSSRWCSQCRPAIPGALRAGRPTSALHVPAGHRRCPLCRPSLVLPSAASSLLCCLWSSPGVPRGRR